MCFVKNFQTVQTALKAGFLKLSLFQGYFRFNRNHSVVYEVKSWSITFTRSLIYCVGQL